MREIRARCRERLDEGWKMADESWGESEDRHGETAGAERFIYVNVCIYECLLRRIYSCQGYVNSGPVVIDFTIFHPLECLSLSRPDRLQAIVRRHYMFWLTEIICATNLEKEMTKKISIFSSLLFKALQALKYRCNSNASKYSKVTCLKWTVRTKTSAKQSFPDECWNLFITCVTRFVYSEMSHFSQCKDLFI